ncbi:NAD-dependent epimerase/dehydratase family protein [Sporolactobacillus pectinivorans]|uniref:NAD-dependent epimerase/dehydratase family protein n=1 Tax=Sporolactobacillus pectinivorans TaxID=1591408 RepID=UPI000C2659B7
MNVYAGHIKKTVLMYGDGEQIRDFTYVGDCVERTLSILYANKIIVKTINIGGTERASILDVITIIRKILKEGVRINFIGQPKGDSTVVVYRAERHPYFMKWKGCLYQSPSHLFFVSMF